MSENESYTLKDVHELFLDCIDQACESARSEPTALMAYEDVVDSTLVHRRWADLVQK
jgi:hypothetical protein